MSTNLEKCPYIKDNHIGIAQSGYSASLLGYGSATQLDVEERDEIKQVCTKCPFYYDKDENGNEKRGNCVYDDKLKIGRPERAIS